MNKPLTNSSIIRLIAIASIALCFACESQQVNHAADESPVRLVDLSAPEGKAIAAFASGCFWCTEHIFEAVVGVDSAVSGYAGGHTPNPTYELVNTETTGHAETVLVYYDPAQVTYEELTKVFFLSHDPTTPNRQGPDVGSSYRSILFFRDDEEKAIAEKAIKEFQSSFADPIVTQLATLDTFYRAEGYHQDYIHHNPRSPYVLRISLPRFEKFVKSYNGKLKEEYKE